MSCKVAHQAGAFSGVRALSFLCEMASMSSVIFGSAARAVVLVRRGRTTSGVLKVDAEALLLQVDQISILVSLASHRPSVPEGGSSTPGDVVLVSAEAHCAN